VKKPGPKPRSFEERFWRLVDVRGADECWPWTGTADRGYGKYEDTATGRRASAHRFAYELSKGPIPDGRSLDHTCHDASVCDLKSDCPHRGCCNPAHLEPVPQAENLRRSRLNNTLASLNAAKTRCPQGHPYDEANTIIGKDGLRRCRICKTDRQRRRRIALRASQ
jgi:hypothetical protein